MLKFQVLVLNNISEKGLALLPRDRYHVAPQQQEPDAILLRSFDLYSITIPKSVKAVGRAGAGVNNIPVDALTLLGVPVFNTPGANANAVKELVLASMIIAARNLIPAHAFVNKLAGDKESFHKAVESGKKQFAGTELLGKTLGIIGLGAIGSRLAQAAIALGMQVLGYDPKITVEAAWRLPSDVQRAQSVEEVLRQGDFISLHVPATQDTKGMINIDRLRLMKPDAVLLNFSRAEIIDAEAMVAALDAKLIKAYACDFPSPKMIDHPDVIAFPHLGASTEESEENCAVMVALQIKDFLEEGTIKNSVNFPNVEMDRESEFRLSLAHANLPNMLGQISTILGEHGLNIHNMVNKSKGDVAYTLVDVDSPIHEDVVAALKTIQGILATRVL